MENVTRYIKIGRRVYEIKKGDYILYNGTCYQFCSGDGRTLLMDGFITYRNLKISKATLKTLSLDNMVKENYVIFGYECIRYFF